MSHRRPEQEGPPELFYNESEAKKYHSNSRMIEIQSQMTERALELLALPEDEPKFLLDLGCGSGLSGEVITEEGHYWVGVDISNDMLNVSKDREEPGEVVLGDIGQGLQFRPGTFDGAISISALQWLVYANKRDQRVPKRLSRLFTSLYAVLKRGSRAVFQFYPENSAQVDLITQQSMKAGFTGGLVVDFPNSSKAKKVFLVLFAGGGTQLPQPLGTSSVDQINYSDRREARGKQQKLVKKSKEWIQIRKDRARGKGKDVREDSKYTGRKRKSHF